MNTIRNQHQYLIWVLVALLIVLGHPVLSNAQQSVDQIQSSHNLLISYQGRLTDADGNLLADGSHELKFKLYNQQSGGTALWSETQNPETSNGVFSVQLGANNSLSSLTFDQTYYLGITVDGGSELAPRTRLTTVPYAQRAHSVDDGSITAEKLAQSGAGDGQILQWNEANNTWETATLSGSGSGWSLSGNSGLNSEEDFLGTTDTSSLVLKVNSTQAFRLIPEDTTASIVMGNPANSIAEGVEGSVISGGGRNVAAVPSINEVNSDFSVIGGGLNNSVTGFSSTISGGEYNRTNGRQTTVSGGYDNVARATSATVGGGEQNTATGENSTVGGGTDNTAEGNAATVPGGEYNNAIGDYSFAAGYESFADHEGSFIWSDHGDFPTSTTGPNQFIVYARGGIGLGTNAPKAQMHVQDELSNQGVSDNPGGNMVLFENTDSGDKPDVLGLQAGPSNPGGGVTYISFYDRSGSSLGGIEGNGSGGVSYKTAGADFAEMLPKKFKKETYEPGELVGINAGKVSKSTYGADQLLVVTGQPGMLGNAVAAEEDASNFVPVTFVGQVPVNVRGPVEAGDLIVASGRGDGTGKALSPENWNPEKHGPVAGRAWEGASGSGIHEVNTSVGLDRLGGVAERLKQQEQKVEKLEDEVSQLKNQVRKLLQKQQD